MSNSYFAFKQFTVHQQHCAMKVSTDACIFGAMLQPKLHVQRCLDIGTGTGVLSLMLAQKKSSIQIDAVEINEDAFTQASENIAASVFANQIKVHFADVALFEPMHRYDFIFSNPPFFENDLVAQNSAINLAKHSTALSLQQLMQHCQRLIADRGEVAIIIPSHRSAALQNAAAGQGFYLQTKICIQHNTNKPFTKEIHVYGLRPIQSQQENLTIKNIDQTYTAQMIALMQDYYLS
jgi:tRNA1Val (adenine37-N6)-methyltransferase